jgi:hypothetical protein
LHFWPTTQRFAEEFPPSVALLRSYDELNTPLPFVVFGAAERALGGGIAVGRWINLSLSLGMMLAIVAAARGPPSRAGIACAGLLVFPYFLGASVLLYTDVMAAALVLLGMALHVRGRPWPGALAFALAIASRQYAVAFPLALVAHELSRRRPEAAGSRLRSDWVAPLLAAATLAGWFLFFGGPAPPVALEAQRLSTAPVLGLHPAHVLYFLATVGAYFVVVEALLRRDVRPLLENARRRLPQALAVAVLAGFVLAPPLRNVEYSIETMGYLDRAARLVLNDPLRMAAFAVLALSCVLRFGRIDLAFWLVWANALMMAKAHIGWDKYALPLIAVLWWLSARGDLEERRSPSGRHRDTP